MCGLGVVTNLETLEMMLGDLEAREGDDAGYLWAEG